MITTMWFLAQRAMNEPASRTEPCKRPHKNPGDRATQSPSARPWTRTRGTPRANSIQTEDLNDSLLTMLILPMML